jgi:hypothetical protein
VGRADLRNLFGNRTNFRITLQRLNNVPDHFYGQLCDNGHRSMIESDRS